jgi:hypothetical protein
MQRHPWLDEIRLIDRAGTPSQIAWIDLGLRALSGARLTEYLKVAVLLLLSGYVSSHARLASTAVDGTWQGRSESPDRTAQAIGELLRTVDIAERFPALNAALVGGAFAPGNDPTYAPFELGLDVMLDGIDHLVKRLASKPATAPA